MSLVISIKELFSKEEGLLAKASHWERTELGKVITLINGYALKSNLFNGKDGFPVLRIRDLKFNSTKTFTTEKFPKEYVINNGDYLVGMDGDFICYRWSGGPAVLNQRVCKIVANDKYLHPQFLFYAINGYLAAIHEVTSSITVKHLSSIDISRIPFPIPPLAEQHRIVAKLDELMERIGRSGTRLDQIPKILKRFRQSVLASAMNGRLTEAWRGNSKLDDSKELLKQLHLSRIAKFKVAVEIAERTNARRPQLPKGLNDAIVYSIEEEYEIPSNWRWSVIDKIATVALGGTPSRKLPGYWNGNINWVSSGEVANNSILETREKITAAGIQNSNAKVYPIGTVLLAMIGEGKTRGQVSILNIEAATNQNVAGLIVDNDFIDSKYLWYFLLSRYESLRNDGLGGAQPALNAERVGQMNVIIPPLKEQKEIVRRIEQLLHQLEKIETHHNTAKVFFDQLVPSLLAKTFRGELVAQDSSDEPASALLSRIQLEKRQAAGRSRKGKTYQLKNDLSLAAETRR